MLSTERLEEEDILSLYAAGRRDFCFTQISVGHLDGRDLSGINLTGASFDGGFISNTNLSGACLFGATFNCVGIYGSNLTGADFTNARFSGSGDCSNVDFTRCSMKNVVFTYADLRNSNFQRVYDANGSIWINCDFTGANGFERIGEQFGGIGIWECIYPNGVKVVGGQGILFS